MGALSVISTHTHHFLSSWFDIGRAYQWFDRYPSICWANERKGVAKPSPSPIAPTRKQVPPDIRSESFTREKDETGNRHCLAQTVQLGER